MKWRWFLERACPSRAPVASLFAKFEGESLVLRRFRWVRRFEHSDRRYALAYGSRMNIFTKGIPVKLVLAEVTADRGSLCKCTYFRRNAKRSKGIK